MVGFLVEVGTATLAQPATIVAAQWRERQVQHHRIPDRRLQIDALALDPADLITIRSVTGVVEQLLDVDLRGGGDLSQTARALPCQTNHGSAGDQHPLAHRLEPDIQLDR